MQLYKPKQLSLIHKNYYLKRSMFAVGVLVFFKLDEERKLISEQDGWKLIGEAMPPGGVLDMGFAKERAEMLAMGSAYAPGGEAVRQMSVRIAIGSVNKTLNVIGDRDYRGGLFPRTSLAEPFTDMPINWKHAWGGEGLAHNPQGKGLLKRALKNTETGRYDLANIYHEKDKGSARKFSRQPVSFAPLDITWPQRAQHQGTYDQHWLDNIHPGFPDDTNTALFNAAAPDQWSGGNFTPGSEYCIEGMHPKKPVLRGCLPSLRVRAFAAQAENGKRLPGDDDFPVKEIKTVIDTVWFFPAQELGVLIYRGVIDANDSDGLDIRQLLIGCENVADTPRSNAYYQHVMALRANHETAAAHVFNDAQLLPEKSPEEKTKMAALVAQAKAENDEKKKVAKALLVSEHLEDTPAEETDIPPLEADDDLPPLPAELIESGDVDLSAYLAHAEAKVAEAEKKAEAMKKQQEAMAANIPDESLDVVRYRMKTPVMVTGVDLKAIQEQATATVATRSDYSMTGAAINGGLQQQKAHAAEQLKAILSRQARQQSPDIQVLHQRLTDEGNQLIRCWVVDALQTGQSLAGCDLSGANLSRLDFSGQNLTDTMFEGCNLEQCRFDDCTLTGAVFTGAHVDHAVFDRVKANQVNFSKACGKQALFNETQLTKALFAEAELPASQWQQANLTSPVFTAPQLNAANFTAATFKEAIFTEACLDQAQFTQAHLSACQLLKSSFCEANFSDATLSRCLILNSQAVSTNFTGVNADKVQFSNQGDFRDCVMTDSQWHTCGFRGLDLTGLVADNAIFIECDFADALLMTASMKKGLFKRCNMMLADLTEADCTSAWFGETTLRKVNFADSTLNQVTLYNSNTGEAWWEGSKQQRMKRYPQPSVR